MNHIASKVRRPFSAADRTIVIVHSVAAAVLGAVALAGADDPDWGGLQRIVILMMLTLWAGGIVATALVARLISNRWARFAVLAVGPLLAIVAFTISAG